MDAERSCRQRTEYAYVQPISFKHALLLTKSLAYSSRADNLEILLALFSVAVLIVRLKLYLLVPGLRQSSHT